MNSRLLLLAIFLLLQACAHEGVMTPNRLALGSDIAEVGSVKRLKPGETVVESPVGYELGARVKNNLDITIVG